MDYYFIAKIKINNEEEYQKYINGVDEVFSRYKGEYLSVDDKPIILEGEWKYTRSVLIKFSSEEDFKNWYYSDDYQSLLKHRLNAAHCDSILVKGIK